MAEAPVSFAAALTDPANIAANRRGAITPAQHTRMRWLIRIVVGVAGATVLLALCASAMTFIVVMTSSSPTTVYYTNARNVSASVALGMLVAAVVFCFSYWRMLAQFWHMHHDLNAGMVAQAIGVIDWRGNQCVAKTTERTLHLPLAATLPAGDYCFYILPESGWILSASRVAFSDGTAPASTAPASPAAPSTPTARDARARLPGVALRCLWRVIYMVIVLAFGGAITFAIASNSNGFIIAAIIWNLLVGLYGLRWVWSLIKVCADLITGEIETITGVVTYVIAIERNPEVFVCFVARRLYEVSPAQRQTLVPGQTYRLHYTRRSRVVITFEALTPAA